MTALAIAITGGTDQNRNRRPVGAPKSAQRTAGADFFSITAVAPLVLHQDGEQVTLRQYSRR